MKSCIGMRTCKSFGDQPTAHDYQLASEFKFWGLGFRATKPDSRVKDVGGFAPVRVSAMSPPRMETSCLKVCHARKGYPYRCLPVVREGDYWHGNMRRFTAKWKCG